MSGVPGNSATAQLVDRPIPGFPNWAFAGPGRWTQYTSEADVWSRGILVGCFGGVPYPLSKNLGKLRANSFLNLIFFGNFGGTPLLFTTIWGNSQPAEIGRYNNLPRKMHFEGVNFCIASPKWKHQRGDIFKMTAIKWEIAQSKKGI